MARHAPAAAADPAANPMLDFVRQFFLTLGAVVAEQRGIFRVDLPNDLVAWFGSRSLRLKVPIPGNEDEAGELVAYGSRIFERMVRLLADKGEYTELALSPRVAPPASLATLQPITAIRATLGSVRQEDTLDRAYAFNFRIAYLSDERTDELYTVVVDGTGRVRPDLVEAETEAVAAPTVRGETGQTGITRALKVATGFAKLHADERGAELEKEILPRLQRAASRLNAFYDAQIEEVPTSASDAGEQIALLRADRAQKIADETARHNLRIQVDLISHAALRLPVRAYTFTLSNPFAQAEVSVRYELHDGQLQLPTCAVCHTPTAALALCHDGHVACPACSAVCHVCGREECRSCGLAACAICGEDHPLCRSCQATCPGCRRTVCPSHLATCPVCGDAVCPDCLVTCPACGRTECRAHGGVCASCGQDVCSQCLGTCANGHTVCAHHLARSAADGKAYCDRCRTTCPDCPPGTTLAQVHATACAVCATDRCATHATTCAICWQPACGEHTRTCPACGRAVCTDHFDAGRGRCTACAAAG